MAYGLFEDSPRTGEAYQETQLSGWSQLSDEDQTAYDAAKSEARKRGVPDVYDEPGYETDPKTRKTRKRWDLLELNDAERKWSESNSTESIDRIRNRGAKMDRQALNLRIMYEYAKAGGKGARSVDDIRKLAWQVRRNRDISTARKVAEDYSEVLGKPVDWRDAYVPTTVPMLAGTSTVREFVPPPDETRVGSDLLLARPARMTSRKLSRAEAMAMEIGDAMKRSGYGDPGALLRAEYLAKRFGLVPVTQLGDGLGARGERTGRTKARRTMAYRAMTPDEVEEAESASVPYDRIVDDLVRMMAEHAMEQGVRRDVALAMARDSLDAGVVDSGAADETWLAHAAARRERDVGRQRRRMESLREELALSPMARALGLYDPELERSVRWRTR